MSSELSLAASACYDSYAVSDDRYQLVPGASCYAVCGWLELLAAD